MRCVRADRNRRVERGDPSPGPAVFFGALFGDKLKGATGFTYRLMRRSKMIADSMPDGDYRDWKDIEAQAGGMAEALSISPTTTSSLR